MEKVNIIEAIKFLLLTIFLNSCNYNYDSELMVPDGHGGGYNLTPLGAFVNGPWEISDENTIYNKKVFFNDKEILSKAEPCSEMQKNLVFELHKNGTISYWLKNEIGSIADTILQNGQKIISYKPPNGDQLKKVYSQGYWKVNFNDSTVFIHFENNIPELKFKYSQLGGSVNFKKISFFDSIYNGKKVTLKQVNTFFYQHPYEKF